ncbi:hypothetical protein A2U01_0093133, partial [Trifolium medium]|nr:hypothetical protein [Trifolium medium]
MGEVCSTKNALP